MKDLTVAGRYAQALFILTEKRHDTAAALEDLKAVRDVLAPGLPTASFLDAPQVRLADKRKVLAAGLEGRANRSVVAFIDLLLRKKRLDLLDVITVEFEALVERLQGIRRAHVVSATPLAEGERTRLLAALEKYTQSKVKLTAEVEPAVMGGALVRIGDHVVDRTVRTLLDSIGAQLREASV